MLQGPLLRHWNFHSAGHDLDRLDVFSPHLRQGNVGILLHAARRHPLHDFGSAWGVRAPGSPFSVCCTWYGAHHSMKLEHSLREQSWIRSSFRGGAVKSPTAGSETFIAGTAASHALGSRSGARIYIYIYIYANKFRRQEKSALLINYKD